MAKPKGPDGPQYESVIENIAEHLAAWSPVNEQPEAFARRLVGLMRMEQKKWQER